jgi:hypothetical protein
MVALAFVRPLRLEAQGVGGGQNYTLFGIGDVRESLGAAFEGMGGVGIAARSPYAVNLANPAAWSDLTLTRFQTGFTFRQQQVTNGLSVANQNNGEPQGLAVGFSIDTTLGASAGFAIVPVSNVYYAFTRSVGALQTVYIGRGGLSQLLLGGAIRPVRHLNLGVYGSYYFGTITERTVVSSFDSSLISGLNTSITDALSGAGLTAGVQYTGIPSWTFGLTATVAAPLSVTNRTEFRFINQGNVFQPDSIRTLTGETAMPLTLGVGIGYQPSRLGVYIDAVTRDFSAFSYRSEANVRFRRSNRLSLGATYQGNVDFATSIFDAINYNVGIGYHEQYYQINDTPINEVYGSLGVSVPITRRSYFDAAVTVGVRGTTERGLLRETFARFSFSVNIGELWFQRFFREE